MTYLFNTPDQERDMLRTIGAESVEDLFEQIPSSNRLNRPLELPLALGEMELDRELRQLAARNSGSGSRPCFMGGGVYDHFIPAAVDEVAGRGEFYTAYTPYQAEASQGSLQAFFEFQSLVCRLTGMDVCNASLYEGGTAVSEAAFMSMRVTDRHQKVVMLGSVHPEYRQVLRTYLSNLQCELVVVPTPEGTADLAKVKACSDHARSSPAWPAKLALGNNGGTPDGSVSLSPADRKATAGFRRRTGAGPGGTGLPKCFAGM